MAHRGNNKTERRKAGGLGKEYIRGLDFLINDQTDKALEVFTRLVEIDQDTIETHLSLGALFRRRGEVDRALRVHQNLIARPNLPRSVHERALLELARDYLAAGVLDRAEELFRELVEMNAYLVESLRRLIRIYEQQSDWDKAIEVNRRLESVSSAHRGQQLHDIAHYHCELAEQKRNAGDQRGAKASFKKALYVFDDCARASIALGDMALAEGEPKEAIKHWTRVPEQAPELTPEVVLRLQQAYAKLGKQPQFYQWLAEVVKQYKGLAPYMLLAEQAFANGDKAQATAWVEQYLAEQPGISGMGRLFSTVILGWGEQSSEPVHMSLRAALADALTNMPAYQCNHCGFETRQIHWQCPSCHKWDSIMPLSHGPAGTLPPK